MQAYGMTVRDFPCSVFVIQKLDRNKEEFLQALWQQIPTPLSERVP